MHRRFGTLAIVIMLALAAVTVWAVSATHVRARVDGGDRAARTDLERLGVYGTVPPFSLVERSGRRVTRDDLRGFVSIVDFIYTRCTDTCPTESAELARMQQKLRDAARLRVVSITVDPAHDTPEVLRHYAERFHAGDRWWFLTGPKHAIFCLALDGFHLPVAEPGAEAPSCGHAVRFGPARAWADHEPAGLVLHTDRIALVDEALRLRAYHRATDPESMVRLDANVRRLLDGRRS